MDRGDTAMKATWFRVLAGGAAIIVIVALLLLEVLTGRIPVDPLDPAPAHSTDEWVEPRSDVLATAAPTR
jgi:hypothetical protein